MKIRQYAYKNEGVSWMSCICSLFVRKKKPDLLRIERIVARLCCVRLRTNNIKL